ncbi:MAG: septum formation protein Maf [Methanosarcinaceae archaeon]|nr:septum formation protein Maf [Methanosarcinaceae archaeon]
MNKIILASASPRRKQLLGQLIGDVFQVFSSSYSEETSEGISPEELVIDHSIGKARDVSRHFKEGVIISADTVIVCNDEIMGKPQNASIAREMLHKISGKQISVITGVTVLDIRKNRELSQCETTRLRIRELSDREIESYIRSGEYSGKAGAFAIQGKGAHFVVQIEGDISNAMGLPVSILQKMLAGFING